MAFRVGQLVVCVDDKPHDGWVLYSGRTWQKPGLDGLKSGVVYTIRGLGVAETGYDHLWLEEIVRVGGEPSDAEPGYRAERFRPVVENRLKIFRSMLVNIPNLEET